MESVTPVPAASFMAARLERWFLFFTPVICFKVYHQIYSLFPLNSPTIFAIPDTIFQIFKNKAIYEWKEKFIFRLK